MTVTAGAPARTAYRLTVNGAPVEVVAPGTRRLLDVLRRDLGLTGTKEGCGEGECGACSVLLDGVLVDSCLVPLCQADGHSVRTVEALGRAAPGREPTADDLDPLQGAFLEAGAVQCGMCIPGMVLAGHAFLDGGAAPTDAAIREAIAGNLCRCTGYTKIIDAIASAAGGGLITRAHGGLPAGDDLLAGGRPAAWPPLRPREPVEVASLEPEAARAHSLDEALGLVADGWRPIAGGTDLMVALATGALRPGERFVDLDGIGALRGIHCDGDTLVVGALATYTHLRRSPVVAAALPVLAEVAASVGAAQVQNRGTVGGNIANASPAGDLLPVVLATDAQLVARSVRGERTLPAAAFFTGYRRTALAADELLVAVRFPLPAGREVRYRKVGTRRAQAISKVVLAVSWRRADASGAWSDVRVAYGSVAPVPIRAPRAEAVLEGAVPSPDLAGRAAAAAEADVRPIDDVRSTAEYRRAVSGRILRRIVLDAIER